MMKWITVNKLHRIALFLGKVFADFFRFMGVEFMSLDEDVPDFWSGFHALAGCLIAVFATEYLSVGYFYLGVLVSFLIMLAYELFIDGLKIEDTRGAQQSDIGYNLIGAVLGTLAMIMGYLLRRWGI